MEAPHNPAPPLLCTAPSAAKAKAAEDAEAALLQQLALVTPQGPKGSKVKVPAEAALLVLQVQHRDADHLVHPLSARQLLPWR